MSSIEVDNLFKLVAADETQALSLSQLAEKLIEMRELIVRHPDNASLVNEYRALMIQYLFDTDYVKFQQPGVQAATTAALDLGKA